MCHHCGFASSYKTIDIITHNKGIFLGMAKLTDIIPVETTSFAASYFDKDFTQYSVFGNFSYINDKYELLEGIVKINDSKYYLIQHNINNACFILGLKNKSISFVYSIYDKGMSINGISYQEQMFQYIINKIKLLYICESCIYIHTNSYSHLKLDFNMPSTMPEYKDDDNYNKSIIPIDIGDNIKKFIKDNKFRDYLIPEYEKYRIKQLILLNTEKKSLLILEDYV